MLSLGMMSTFVIGDVHGAGRELKHLIEVVIQPAPDDRIILVGDAFDRGLDAGQVWDLIQKYQMEMTLGNHEAKQIGFLSGTRRKGLPPHYHYALRELEKRIPMDAYLEWLGKLPRIIRIGEKCLVTHAGVCLDDPWREDDSANVYGHIVSQNVRGEIEDGKHWWDLYQGEVLVLYGHLVTGEDFKPRLRYQAGSGALNSVGLDTAVVHGGPCTAWLVEEHREIQYRSGVNWYDEFRRRAGKGA
ncbi:MAG: fructose-bisphosphatase class III [Phycisphaerales bacterium]|nr:fructose-bisphosphatase class III [Phycisphaerales bacterium]